MKYLKENKLRLAYAVAVLMAAIFIDPSLAIAGVLLSTTSTATVATGTKLYISSGSPTSFLQIANAKNIQWDNGSSAKIDVTHLDSAAKEFRVGLSDPGTLTFEVDIDLGDVGQAAMDSARNTIPAPLCEFKIVLPSGTTPTWIARGYVAKFDKGANTDNPVKSMCEIFITGPWTKS